MIKILALAGTIAMSAFAGAAGTIQATATSVAVYDYCGLMRYTRCGVVGSMTLPTTSDPRHQAELTRLVRQVSRDRL